MNDNPGVHKIELHQPKKAFAIIPNRAVRDPNLTANSFRLLAYLLSHNDGYELTYRQIEKQTGLGRYAINAASKQLTERGWLRVEQTKLPNGQFGPKSWTLLTPSGDEPVAGDSVAGEPAPDGFHSGTAHGLKKTTVKENNLKENTKEIEDIVPSQDSAFDDWWSYYPRKEGKGAAKKEFVKALKKASLEVLINAAESYSNDLNREPKFTVQPARWLREERWGDGPLPLNRSLTNSEKNIQNFRASMALLESEPMKEVENGQVTSNGIADFGVNLRSADSI
jgi:predicted transcriptional regulator